MQKMYIERQLKLNESNSNDFDEFEFEHDCINCGGVGTRNFGNIKCHVCEGTGNLLRKEYEDAVKSDRKLWNKYQSVIKIKKNPPTNRSVNHGTNQR